MSILWYVVGGALLVATTIGRSRVLIAPRRAWSLVASPALAAMVAVFPAVARRLRRPDPTDRCLGFLGPLYVVGRLGTFLLLYTLASTARLVPDVDDGGEAARESGSSVFTLGFLSSPGAVQTSIDISAAATGMVVIALFIAYLPARDQAVEDRERFVELVQGRLGDRPRRAPNRPPPSMRPTSTGSSRPWAPPVSPSCVTARGSDSPSCVGGTRRRQQGSPGCWPIRP